MPTPSALKPGTVKHEGLADYLREQILSGKIKDGDRLPSFKELHEKFVASTTTINRAFTTLEQENLILREERRRVIATPGRRTARRQKGILGVSGSFIYHGATAYWGELLKGISWAAAEAGMQVLLVDTVPSADWEKADGVLVCDWNGRHILSHVPSSVPCVSFMAQSQRISSVTADDYTGERLAAEHLLELGHRNIAFLTGRDCGIREQREGGYRDALKAAGIKPDDRLTRTLGGAFNSETGPTCGAEFTEAGRASTAGWLSEDWSELGITAVLAHNDEVAIGVIEALQAAGLRVPGDVSVVGFDGTEGTEHFRPRLTTMQLPLQRIGAMAVETLLPLLAGDYDADDPGVVQHKIVPVRLKVGESTAAPAAVPPGARAKRK